MIPHHIDPIVLVVLVVLVAFGRLPWRRLVVLKTPLLEAIFTSKRERRENAAAA